MAEVDVSTERDLAGIQECVFTGNVLRLSSRRPGQTDQVENIAWLSNLLGPVFHSHFGKAVRTLTWQEGSAFDSRVVYRLHKHPLTDMGYARLLSEAPDDRVCDYLGQHLRDSLVVGFEMPDFLIKALLRLDIPYVDIMLAPWRYLPDLTFGIRTSDERVFDRLWRDRLTDAELASHAGLLRAGIARMPALDEPDNIAILAGQVTNDVSLLNQGKFMRLEEFEDRVADLCSQHSKVLFKAHPYNTANDKRQQRRYLRRFGNVGFTDTNIYYLMAQYQVSGVYAITSSVTQEAKYFDVHADTFARYPFSIGNSNTFDPFTFVPVYGVLPQPSYWAAWLDWGAAGGMIEMSPGSLRRSLGMSWGADFEGNRLPRTGFRTRFERSLRLFRYRLGWT